MKYKNYIVTFVMAVVLFGFAAAAWLGKTEDFSISERRELEQMPEVRLESVIDGTFMDDFEAYTLDQFPLRDWFRRLKAEVAFGVLGQKDNNGIYVADGYASKMEYPLNEPMLEYAAERFFYIYENYLQDAGDIYFSIVPDKNYYLARENGYLALDYEELVRSMREKTEYMAYVDLMGCLESEDYYSTDTHWRQESLVDVAEVLFGAMNAGGGSEAGGTVDAGNAVDAGATVNESKYEVCELEPPFYGVYYGQSALPLEPDSIRYLNNEMLKNCKVTCYDTGAPVEIPMYDMEKAVGKDPYEMFLSGTRAVLTIENPSMAGSGKELVVFRDSFGSSLVPLLAEGYEKITVLDIRYVNSSMLDQFVDFEGQDVLFLYSTLVLNNSLSLK